MRCWRTVSNSLSGKAGSRRMSAARRSAPGRLASMVLDAGAGVGGAAGYVHLSLEAIHFVLDLLARSVLCAAHEKSAGDSSDGGLADERLLVAVADGDGGDHSAAAGLAGEQGHFHAVGQRAAHDARFDIGGAGIESLAGSHDCGALEILEGCSDVGRRRNLGAVGALRGDEGGERAIGFLQVVFGDA